MSPLATNLISPAKDDRTVDKADAKKGDSKLQFQAVLENSESQDKLPTTDPRSKRKSNELTSEADGTHCAEISMQTASAKQPVIDSHIAWLGNSDQTMQIESESAAIDDQPGHDLSSRAASGPIRDTGVHPNLFAMDVDPTNSRNSGEGSSPSTSSGSLSLPFADPNGRSQAIGTVLKNDQAPNSPTSVAFSATPPGHDLSQDFSQSGSSSLDSLAVKKQPPESSSQKSLSPVSSVPLPSSLDSSSQESFSQDFSSHSNHEGEPADLSKSNLAAATDGDHAAPKFSPQPATHVGQAQSPNAPTEMLASSTLSRTEAFIPPSSAHSTTHLTGNAGTSSIDYFDQMPFSAVREVIDHAFQSLRPLDAGGSELSMNLPELGHLKLHFETTDSGYLVDLQTADQTLAEQINRESVSFAKLFRLDGKSIEMHASTFAESEDGVSPDSHEEGESQHSEHEYAEGQLEDHRQSYFAQFNLNEGSDEIGEVGIQARRSREPLGLGLVDEMA